MEGADETDLKGMLLMLALVLLAADILASLWLSGRLKGPRATTAMLALALIVAAPVPKVWAQDAADDTRAIDATSDVVVAYVLTGDARLDDVSRAGLAGLSQSLYR